MLPESDLPEPDSYVELPDGRQVAVDDRGDPGGVPVLYFHGTPDTRLARHPDDRIARDAGVRLIAADRPGLGSSDVDPDATPLSVADDHRAILDQLGIDSVAVFAWSAGAVPAVAFAGRYPERVRRLTLVAPLIPADAYETDGVLEGADDSRRMFADVVSTTPPDEAGRELAMWLVPPEIDERNARIMLAESIAALDHVDGAADALVAALRGSVAQGMTGIEREVTAQATPLGPLLDAVARVGAVHVGADDGVTPPAMSRWLADRLGLALTVHRGEGHLLAISRWRALLVEAAQPSAALGASEGGSSGSSQSMDGTSDQRRSNS